MKEIESNQQIVDAVEAGMYLIVHTSVKLCRNKQSQPRTVIVVLQSAVVPAWRTGRRNSNALQYPEMVGLYTYCCHACIKAFIMWPKRVPIFLGHFHFYRSRSFFLFFCSARSEIIIVSPKKITVGSTSTSDQPRSRFFGMVDNGPFLKFFYSLVLLLQRF